MSALYQAGVSDSPVPIVHGASLIARGVMREQSPSRIYRIGTGKIAVGGIAGSAAGSVVDLMMFVAHVILIAVGLNVLVQSF